MALLSTLGMHVSSASEQPEDCAVASAVDGNLLDAASAAPDDVSTSYGSMAAEGMFGDSPIEQQNTAALLSEESHPQDALERQMEATPALISDQTDVVDQDPILVEGVRLGSDVLQEASIECHKDMTIGATHDIKAEDQVTQLPPTEITPKSSMGPAYEPHNESQVEALDPTASINDADSDLQRQLNETDITMPITNSLSEQPSVPPQELGSGQQMHQPPSPLDQRSAPSAAIALPPVMSGLVTEGRKGLPAVASAHRPKAAGNLFDVFMQVL